MKKKYSMIMATFLLPVLAWSAVNVRIKDIAVLQGIRENQLIGYGLVVGLNGKGDSSRSVLTRKTMKTFLKHLGVNSSLTDLRSGNAAVVVVTATIKPFARQGDRIDVNVSSLADASSLAGGVLLQTPLKAANNRTYAVAQGQILVGGNENTTKNSGRIPQGGMVETAVPTQFIQNDRIQLVLKDQDFTTIHNIGKALQTKFKGIQFQINNPATVTITVPEELRTNTIGFISQVELLQVQADTPARVVVDGKSGTVVMGDAVRIGTVAVSYNGIKISVGNFSKKTGSSFMLDGSASVKSLVDGLNKIGAKTADIINILQAIEKAGALKAQLIIM